MPTRGELTYFAIGLALGGAAGANWSKIKPMIEPLLESGTERFGGMYDNLARMVAERFEAFQDASTERRHKKNAAANAESAGKKRASQSESAQNNGHAGNGQATNGHAPTNGHGTSDHAANGLGSFNPADFFHRNGAVNGHNSTNGHSSASGHSHTNGHADGGASVSGNGSAKRPRRASGKSPANGKGTAKARRKPAAKTPAFAAERNGFGLR